MMFFKLCLIGFSMLTAAAGSHQAFTSSAEMNISSCPITYYGQKYEKVYVGFNADRFAVCFKGLYQPGIQNDCILMSGGMADRGGLSVLRREIPTGSGVHKLLPNLKYAGKCVNVIPLKDCQQSQVEQVELGNFGAQSILAIKTYSGYTNVNVVADAQVNGLTVSKHTFQTSETNSGVITDVSGCRFSGLVYETNITVNDPRICSTVTCDVSGAATAVSHCGPLEHCQGDGSCAMNTVCSVTGSTVIGFTSKLQSVSDRCGYSLLRSSSLPGLHVLGIFKERRRKDLSFLDRVILELDREGPQISLEQGSKVKVNDEFLIVHATPQIVHSVVLTKSHTGVNAKFETSNFTVSVVFDGHTAIIHLSGSSEVPVEGLCGDSSSTVNEQKPSVYSDTGCQTQYEDDSDSTSSCNTTAKWCGLLQEGSFTACNSYVDPEPFIQACIQTLCKYPAVDGLTCHFLKRYAEVCKYIKQCNSGGLDITYQLSVSVPQDGCQDMFCSSHEFCGVDSSSRKPRCHCRGLFASKYKPTNSFGEPIVCADKAATVTLANCLLEDKGINYSVLHLNDQSCRGQLDNLTHLVTFSFSSQDTCGTVVQANNSQIIYKNAIVTQNIPMFGLITRHDKVHMDFSCRYSQPDIKTLSIRFRQSSVIQHISSGEWKYNLTMEAYTSRDRTKPIDSDADIDLNQRLWVELKTYGLEEDRVAVVTDSCSATNQPLPTGGLRYNLIIDGCPNPKDPTVAVERNGLGTSTIFSFNTFQFTGSNGNVFLHCKVELCVRQGDNCIQRCTQTVRGRRSARPKNENIIPAFISVAWTY
ncbi:alpha-tectorin-like [Poeciliopsis prolifica]|uniref:alpha-tectorin-like n=1 Tax=Poeciliopsis prolifica TaxID=188132 RepID=UPI0024141AE5|nr:alpha-tectorin-like [Poeciliopsis prolifica]